MVLGEVNSQDEIATIVKGGKGASPLNDYRAEEGQILSVNLDLKHIADVGLIGFLNVYFLYFQFQVLDFFFWLCR